MHIDKEWFIEYLEKASQHISLPSTDCIFIVIKTSETRGQSTGVVISITQYVMQIYQSCSYQWE